MATNLHISVLGRPSPQGSKKHVGGGRMIEASKYLPAWRKAVCTAAVKAVQDELWAKLAGPVELAVTFYLERPTTIKPDKRPMPINLPTWTSWCAAFAMHFPMQVFGRTMHRW